MKPKTVYICQECGAESASWYGRCSACGQWNTLVEEQREAPPPAQWRYPLVNITPSDFTYYAVAHETYNALFALCE